MISKIKNYKNFQIHFLYFNQENNLIYVYYNANSCNSIDIFCGEKFCLLYNIKIPKIDFKTVTDLKFNIETQEFVICYFDRLAIHDINGNLISLSNIEGVISSKYYNESEILLELYEFSSNRSLGLFNTKHKNLKKYELESLGHYNRNFAIEKTNNLLFGLCNAYENRMYLHLLNFEKDTLKFVCENGLFCHRDEIESSSIELNSLGDEYMFVVNADLDRMTICIYSIYNQNKPLREISIVKDKIPILHLLFDKYLVVEYDDKFGLLNLQIKDSLYNNKSRTFDFFEKDAHLKISINKKGGLIAFILNNELQILKIDDAKLVIDENRKIKMKEFIENVRNNKFLMSDIDDFY